MKSVVLLMLKIYQKYISQNFLRKSFLGNNCRFSPTCSTYTYDAVAKYGTIKGLILGIKRLSKCHPFFKGGFDPVK